MASEAEIEAAAKAITTHPDGGNIHPGSSRIGPFTIDPWINLARAALEAAERVREGQAEKDSLIWSSGP